MSAGQNSMCKNCKHWLSPERCAERQALITRRLQPVTGHFGQCKRNTVGLGSAEFGEYPRTSPSDWCQEWQNKGPKPVAPVSVEVERDTGHYECEKIKINNNIAIRGL
jgi:hypothetical protein